jgi:F420-non-reducing hydrogenase iron-sulfur subunit
MSDEFEPKIVAFLCNWCSYTGADLAGVSRFKYPPNILPIRVMCSGRVDPFMVMFALRKGADAVMICGCHIGDCHYLTGNWQTEKRIPLLKKALECLGVDPRRVRLEWISASEGAGFVEAVTNYVAEVKTLGPSPLKGASHDRRHSPAL